MSLYDEVKSSGFQTDFLKNKLTNLARKNKILSNITLELSPVCNFSCPFCYAKLTPKQLEEAGEKLLDFEQWKRIIDDIIEMDVDSLSFTGGEVMLYPDFAKVYSYAHEKEATLSFISNCSSLTPELLKLFTEKKPTQILVTVYGASRETYEKVCGNADFYDRVTENIMKLHNAGINVALQTTVCNDNVDDIPAIKNFANNHGFEYRFSGELNASRNCTAEKIQNYGVDMKRYCEKAYEADNGTLEGYSFDKYMHYEGFTVVPPDAHVITKGMPCGGGRSSCVINYKGFMQPCISFPYISVDTKNRKIADCWEEVSSRCDEIPRITECETCKHRLKCKTCISAHYNDLHEFGKPSPRLCYKRLYPKEAKRLDKIFEEKMKNHEFERK